MHRYLTVGYLTTIVGGVLLALGAGIALVTSRETFSATVVTSAFLAASTLRLLGAAAMIMGLTAVFVRESSRAGTFGLVAYALVIVNLVLQAGTMWSDLFVTGVLAVRAPEILDGTVSDPRLDAAFLAAWLMNATFILLGIATLRARVFSPLVGWMLIVMGAVTLVPLPVDGPAYEVVIGLACMVAGAAAIRVRPLSAELPVGAPVLAPR
jgi:hypothetical protein